MDSPQKGTPLFNFIGRSWESGKRGGTLVRHIEKKLELTANFQRQIQALKLSNMPQAFLAQCSKEMVEVK